LAPFLHAKRAFLKQFSMARAILVMLVRRFRKERRRHWKAFIHSVYFRIFLPKKFIFFSLRFLEDGKNCNI
jgi:hypothetical protein